MREGPNSSSWTRPLLIAAFVASGFSALLYQTVWQRLLAFFSGADVYSVTITVAAFMAGLGLGSLVGGHLADRVGARSSLRLFALAELAIAAFALASVPLIYGRLYLRFGSVVHSPWTIGSILFTTLLWPTFCMGLSLPLLSKALAASSRQPARSVSLLYGFNTLGAAAGSLVTVWLLVRHFGFDSAVNVGAALNLGCAILAFAVAKDGSPEPEGVGISSPSPTTREGATPRGRSLSLPTWAAVYLFSGFIALSLEILWFRVLGVILKANAFTFGTLLGLFLLGLGSGSILALRFLSRIKDAARAFFWLQAAIGLYAGCAILLLLVGLDRLTWLGSVREYLGSYEAIEIGTAIRALQGVAFDASNSTEAQRALAAQFAALYVAVPVWLLVPPTMLMGASFTFLQKAVHDDLRKLGRRVGWLQAANIAGSLAGAFLTGLVFLDYLGAADTLRLLVVASGAFLCLGFARETAPAPRRAFMLALGATAFVAWRCPSAEVLWARLHGTTPQRVRIDEDKSGLSVLKTEADRPGLAVFVNGLGQSWLPFGGIHTVLGALPALVHPKPERIVVIGLGSGDTVYAAAVRAETRAVDCVEIISSQQRSLARPDVRSQFAGIEALLSDPRIRLVTGDGRAFLMRSPLRYDIIEADALRPNNAYAGNLYSLEYFELLRSRLAPGGLAVTWAPTSRIRDTFAAVFPHVFAFRGVLIGSETPIAFDAVEIRRRLDTPGTRAHFEGAGVRIQDLLAPYLGEPPLPVLRASRPLADPNSDLFPRDEFLTPRP